MQLILFIIQKQLNMNNQLKCDTVAQYKAYQLVLCQEKVPVKMRNMHSYTQLPVHCIDFFL